MTADAPGFELLRFEAVPAAHGVAVVELEGRFADRAPHRPRLLIERGQVSVEVPPVTVEPAVWSASFAVALDVLADERTTFGLVPGRGPVIALPEPVVDRGDVDRYVALARAANDLRHRLTAREEELAAALCRVDAIAAERDERLAELAGLRSELAAAERRAEDAERSAAAARDQRTSMEAAAEQAREELRRVREELQAAEARATEAERDRAALRARAEAADRTAAELREREQELEERVAELEAERLAAHDEARAARLELRDARARLEAVRRDERFRHARAADGEESTVQLATAAPDEPAAAAEDDAAGGAQPAAEHDDSAAAQPAAEPDTEAPDAEGDEALPPPRTAAAADNGATRPTRTVRIFEPGEEDEEPVLDPAAVGARYIEPSETRPEIFTPARLMVVAALVLLVAALIAIFLGAGVL